MSDSFLLRANERGHDLIRSDGPAASYVAGHPGAYINRFSSFNFGPYQGGRAGFGTLRVFGDETFVGAGCGYNMHPHHNFIICAFVLKGELTHINTPGRGMVDQLRQGDYYVFSAGSGGKHCELSVSPEDTNVLYLWAIPSQLYLPPTYHRAHFDLRTRRNRIVQLVGDADVALPAAQDLRVSRLTTDRDGSHDYRPRSLAHGLYVFVIDGDVTWNGTALARRDSFGVVGAPGITLEVAAGSDLLLVETAMPEPTALRQWEAAQPHHDH